MNQWRIDIDLQPLAIDPVQREFFIVCQLANAGVPINPLTHDLTHGELTFSVDMASGNRHYTWIGEDRRQ